MRALLVGALLLCGPVSAQEPRVEARHVVAPCLPESLLERVLEARRAEAMPMGLDAEGAVWNAYLGPDGAWMLTLRIEGRTCVVTAGAPGSWLGYVPER